MLIFLRSTFRKLCHVRKFLARVGAEPEAHMYHVDSAWRRFHPSGGCAWVGCKEVR